MALSIPDFDSADSSYSKCSMYDVNYTEVMSSGIKKADPSWPIKACQHGWEFNFTEVPYSTVATDVRICNNEEVNGIIKLFPFYFHSSNGCVNIPISPHCPNQSSSWAQLLEDYCSAGLLIVLVVSLPWPVATSSDSWLAWQQSSSPTSGHSVYAVSWSALLSIIASQ